jgi:NAD(P)-dependent dehydrogenase (short-subunit alcohol dehydrogenase family)
MNGLRGQTVVVIGGSAGIGLATARRAREEGAAVILAARDPERLRRVGQELGAGSIAAFDATDFERLGRFFAELPGRHRRAGRPPHDEHGRDRRDLRHRRRPAARRGMSAEIECLHAKAEAFAFTMG